MDKRTTTISIIAVVLIFLYWYNTRSKRTQRNQDIAGNNLGGFFNNKGQQ